MKQMQLLVTKAEEAGMTTESESDHILFLSRELLDDIELQRLDADKLLLKCSRLARLAGTDEIKQWMKLEMEGSLG